MRRRVTLGEGSRGDDFSRVQKCARHLGIMLGESLSLSLDGTPRRAEPKTARRWTEKEAGKGKDMAERSRGERRTDGAGERKGEERCERRGREREKGRRRREECTRYEIFPDAG